MRFVALQIPGLTQRKLEEITGVPQAQVNRALNGSTAGDGQSGHGGDRTRTTKREVYKLDAALQKSTRSCRWHIVAQRSVGFALKQNVVGQDSFRAR